MKRVKEIFKKYLIPHEGNDHQPYLLRYRAVMFTCLVAIGIQCVVFFYSSYVIPRSNVLGAIFANTLIAETNQNRLVNTLPALAVNPLLVEAAQEKADDMVKNNYFAHVSPAGVTPWQWFANVGYDFSAAGENLAVNFSDSADVTDAWMNSPEHRANILNSGFTEIGVATAEGTYNGEPAIYIVELFGTPAATFVVNSPVVAKKTVVPKIPAKLVTISPLAAVKGVATTVAEPVTTSVLSLAPITETKTGVAVDPITKVVATPRQTMNYLYLFIIAVFSMALLLDVFVKIRIQHPNVIFGGILVIAVVGLCMMLGQYAALSHATIL